MKRASVLAFFSSGCDLRFAEPSHLALLLLLPLVITFFVWSERRRQRLTEALVGSTLAPRLSLGLDRGRRRLKAAMLTLALAALVVALAEPQYGYSWQNVKRRGVDLVIALDVSDSMLVPDGPGGVTRLERAKRELLDLLEMLEGDRVAIVAFAGEAMLACPLTVDYGAARQYLEEVTPELVATKGTALGAAIRTSLEAFEQATGESRAVLLITDGEDTTGEGAAAAEKAKEAGVRIYAVGIGRDEGAPIPSPNGGFRRDASGALVLSRLDEPALSRIALLTGGAYARSVTGDVDLENIYRRGIKADVLARDLDESRSQRWHHRFQWFVALAMILLAVEALLPERSRRTSHAA